MLHRFPTAWECLMCFDRRSGVFGRVLGRTQGVRKSCLQVREVGQWFGIGFMP
jgi:hypothetical protein